MDIKGFEDYYTISRDGKVWSKRKKIYRIPYKDKKGYLRIGLNKDGKQKYFLIHRLLAIAYIDNPENKETVDHIDRNPSNNNLDNLRWATRTQQKGNQKASSNTGYKYITHYINKEGREYYRVTKRTKTKKIFDYALRCDEWTLEEAVEIRDCLCRRHDVPLLDWVD